MWKYTKYAVFAILILGFFALFIYTEKLSPEFIFAGIAYLIATLQARLFGSGRDSDDESIETQHRKKRREWQAEEDQYDARSRELEEKLNETGTNAERLRNELDSLKGCGVRTKYTEDEIFKRLEL